MRTDEMASEFPKGYDGGYALGFRRGVREGRLELLREDVLDLARVMASRAYDPDLSEEEAQRLAKTVMRAAQRLLCEEAKEDEA